MSIEVISEKKTKIGQVTVTFTVGRIVSQAKATEGKAGMAGGDDAPVRRSTAGTGLRVGEASADLPATSEIMGVTARRDWHPTTRDTDGEQGAAKEPRSIQRERANPGETAPNAVAETRRAGSAGISPPEVFAAPISTMEERG